MAYIEATVVYRTVFLSLVDVPALGIPYTDVTVGIKQSGGTAFTPKVLQVSDWIELGNGLYSIKFNSTDTDTVGDFTYVLSGSDFDNFLYDEFTIEPAPTGGVSPAVLQQCVVSGTLANIMALPPTGEPLKIVAYTPQFPAKYQTTIVSGDVAWTFADAYGNFTLPLLRKSTVIVEIKRCGIRAQITIPDAPTANLLDLLPPFEIDYSL
jgi:hypothetical protein